ncbi:hypothetical protein ALC62_04053, partial [Cyphomyrmex costatus]
RRLKGDRTRCFATHGAPYARGVDVRVPRVRGVRMEWKWKGPLACLLT